MAFRNAASVVIARIFRIMGSGGKILAQFGSRISSVFGVTDSPALEFMHDLAGTTNSAIIWTVTGLNREFDIVGPGDTGEVPPSIALLDFPATGQTAIVLVGGQNVPGGNAGAEIQLQKFNANGNTATIHSKNAGGTGADAGIQSQSNNTDASTLLTLFSPTVPDARRFNIDTVAYVGYTYGESLVYSAELAAGVNIVANAPPGTFILGSLAVLEQPRDRAIWDINVTIDWSNVVAGWNTGVIDLTVFGLGSSFGAGVNFGNQRIIWGENGPIGNRITLSRRYFLPTTEVPGTLIGFRISGWRFAAAGTLTANGGGTRIDIIRKG